MNPLSWPIEKAQKLIAIAAAVFFLVTSLTALGLWQSTKGDLKRVTGERNVALEAVGEWRAVVGQWEAINEQWKGAIKDMRAAKQAADDEIDEAQAETRKLRRDLNAASAALRRRKPVGDTEVARLVDADRAYQEELRGLQ